MVLEILNVVKAFGKRRALDGVSLELRQGEVLGLLGPNGAGKSTLVRTIAGRVVPDSGEVRIFGKPAPAGDTVAHQQVGIVPQEIAIYPLMTARENLVVFGRFHGLSGSTLTTAVKEGLDWAGLTDRASDITKGFSGGMKRRLNMAAGVLHKPKILLLDEPTVGVDPQSRERIYQMIAVLRSQGVSLLYTTHYMEEAERLCERIVVIDHGRAIASGTKDELVRSTIGSQREIVISCLTEPDEKLRSELTKLGAEVESRLVRYQGERSSADMLRIVSTIESKGTVVEEVMMKPPTLEKVFLHLTGRDLRE